MFGIPLATITTILGLAVTYGPRLIALIQVLAPVIEAAAPAIEKMIAAGIPETDAAKKVFGHLAGVHKMTREEEERWFERVQGEPG